MYTQQERHRIYKELHASIDIEDGNFYLCHNLPVVRNVGTEHLEKLFPEMAIMLNILESGHYAAWTEEENPGHSDVREINERRKTILEFCIEMTNPN